jgi:hypothetical protein
MTFAERLCARLHHHVEDDEDQNDELDSRDEKNTPYAVLYFLIFGAARINERGYSAALRTDSA